MVISEAIIFLVIFIVIAISGFLVVRKFAVSGVKRFSLIISYLGGVSALLITFNIYITIRSNNRIEANRIAYNTVANIGNSYIKPQKEIIDCYPETFNLYASMNQDIDMSAYQPKKCDDAKRVQDELYSSIRVFQAMEDFLSTGQFDITGKKSWLNSYLMWMQSPTLQKYWGLLSCNFADDTRALMARIIEKSDELVALRKQKGKLTVRDYDEISEHFKVHYRK